MAFSRPLVEYLYDGTPVCSLCGGPCNGSPEPTGPVVGERALEKAFITSRHGDLMGGPDWVVDNVRPQPGRPGNTNEEPDFDPKVIL